MVSWQLSVRANMLSFRVRGREIAAGTLANPVFSWFSQSLLGASPVFLQPRSGLLLAVLAGGQGVRGPLNT